MFWAVCLFSVQSWDIDFAFLPADPFFFFAEILVKVKKTLFVKCYVQYLTDQSQAWKSGTWLWDCHIYNSVLIKSRQPHEDKPELHQDTIQYK